MPTIGGPVTWTASWAGDATYASVSTTGKVKIARLATALTIRTSATTYVYRARATVTVHLGTTFNRRDVYIYARPLGTSLKAPGTLLAHVRVNSLGSAVVSYTMRRRTTFTASGAWRSVPAFSCGILDSSSRGYAALSSNRPRGVTVRIRAFVPNDSVSQTLGATSAWVYLKFT